MKKYHIRGIIGCATALIVAAWGQNVKADYTDASVIEEYWDSNPEIFAKKFEEFFQKPEELHPLFEHSLWSKEKNSWEAFCIRCGLYGSVDAVSERICKTLGSLEFFESVLTQSAVCGLEDAAERKSCKTKIGFYKSGEVFPGKNISFDKEGDLLMETRIQQIDEGNLGIQVSFTFSFKKKGNNVSLERYKAVYQTDEDSCVKFWQKKP